MNKRLLISLFGYLLAGTLSLSGTALAQGSPPDYGDLIIIHRYDTGVPVLDEFSCQQPIAFPDNVGCPIAPDCGGDDPCLIPIDTETCTIPFDFATCANEADFGRTNLSRASEDVLDFQLEDVLIKLATADCTSLDPSGRMVASYYAGEELTTSTIDSPLQNLSVYKHLVRDGSIGVPLPQGATELETAARGFGVAMDKSGEVNVDLLSYLNEILGLTQGETVLFGEPICIDVKEEVMGEIMLVEKCFLNYGNFGYNRTSNFSALPSPAYIPEDAPAAGFFEYLMGLGGDTYSVTSGPIMTVIFGDEPGYTDGDIGGFVQAADDTREVINYMHENPVPADAVTAVTCTPTPNPTDQYDLSISKQSGLKVPKQVVATTEGREFVVTVANNGPDTGAGMVRVTAVRGDGGEVLVNGLTGPFEFTFDGLLPGMSFTTGPVIFTLSEPYNGTTITWDALAVADDDDPNTSNNLVTKISNVRVTSGGH